MPYWTPKREEVQRIGILGDKLKIVYKLVEGSNNQKSS